MTLVADKQHESNSRARLVEVTKMANSRVGVGLVMRGRSVIVHQVAATSPLEGKVFPGDVINLAGNGLRAANMIDALTSTRAPDAHALSAAFHAASSLSITVETPALLASASSVFLLVSEADSLGIRVDKCPTTGRARVAHIEPMSAAATNLSRQDLAIGDLIVSVSEGGTLFDVADVKEAATRLNACESGAVELRVVRAAEITAARPRSSRPASARPRTADPAMSAFEHEPMPPAYTAAVAPGGHV